MEETTRKLSIESNYVAALWLAGARKARRFCASQRLFCNSLQPIIYSFIIMQIYEIKPAKLIAVPGLCPRP